MFRILLERADTEPVSFDERLALSAEQLGEEIVSVESVSIRGTLEKASEGYSLNAELAGSGQLRCVRCLEPFAFEFNERFALSLRPVGAAPRDDDTRLGRSDLDVAFYDTPDLDLTTMAAEQVLLAVPMKPLCREGCRGLCPRCGANWNTSSCECPVSDADERWAPLEEWRPTN